MMSQSPSATTGGTEQKRTAKLSTPDHDMPGVTDLSSFRPGDQIRLGGHSTPLTVEFVGVRQVTTVEGVTDQYAVTASHDRSNARQWELIEHINLADGGVIQIVDGDGQSVCLYEVAQ